ncbi:MAG: inosine/xanthosine triphosphatase [Candidatus Roizmanbacteria bacterium]|nr:inosine/xanthosine triphosphatase [Candidatus Roizmanbacteria bacterium]
MKILVGSKNQAKIDAVSEILREYPHLALAEVSGAEASSGVSDQPKSLEETVRGAKNRAKGIFKECDYSIGVESGLMHVPGSKSGYMDVCVCAIYDGSEFHIGLSSAWEFPDVSTTDLMIKEGLDMSQAINKAGMTKNPQIGSAEGAIGILTKGRMNRKEYTKQALRTALIHLEQFDF